MEETPLPVDFLPRAAEELHQAATWYDDQRPGLGRSFVEELRGCLDELSRHPSRGLAAPTATLGLIRLRRFPYLIAYRRTDDTLLVVAIGHTRRHPAFWPQR